MIELDPATHFKLFTLENFLDQRMCREIIAEMIAVAGDPATVYGRDSSGSVDEGIRRAMRNTPSSATVEMVTYKLDECRRAVEEHFGVSLGACEEPQFLRYRVGDFFVAHQDGNTGLMRMDTEARRVSVVIFLNEQSDLPQEDTYCGGSLLFHDWRGGQSSMALPASRKLGTFVAFRSETTHEVTPVTHGERYSIVSWYR